MNDCITKEEIEKWTNRINEIKNKIKTENSEMLTNMNAYISDSQHFKEKGDLVRSFEAIVWAWAIYEICMDLKVFSIKE